VLQVDASNEKQVLEVFRESGIEDCVRTIGRVTTSDRISFAVSGRTVLSATRTELRSAWSETTFRMQSLRDNPACAEEEYRRATDPDDPGLHARLAFDPAEDVAAPMTLRGARPAIAILREQGVNSQLEMAAAFHRAGFAPVDVHMTDLIAGRARLDGFRGLVACGGFSYGDVLGAGEGWAKSILFNAQLRLQFEEFFVRGDSFTLGVCNGCQMLAALKSLVPARHTGRGSSAIAPSSSRTGGAHRGPAVAVDILLWHAGLDHADRDAHGEGRAEFTDQAGARACVDTGLVSLRFVDNRGLATETYPANPNGSPLGITGLTSEDGRATILMPHPERVFRTVQNSWHPAEWGEDSGWMRMFRNARVWVG